MDRTADARRRAWRPPLRLACVLAACMLLPRESTAAEATDPPRGAALRVARAPCVDGRLDEPCWQAAPALGPFHSDGDAVAAATEARILYDDEHLYVGFVCQEPAMDRLVVRSWRQRDGQVCDDEAVWVYLDPWLGRKAMFEVNINANGVLYDALVGGCGSGGDCLWNAEIAQAVSREKDRWCVEVAIPFAALRLFPRVKETWGLNPCRNRPGAPGKKAEEACWSKPAVAGGWHHAWKFGLLEGLDVDFSRYAWEVSDLQWKPPRRGANTVSFSARNHTGKTARVRPRVVLYRRSAQGKVCFPADTVEIEDGSTAHFTLAYELPDGEVAELAVQIAEEKSGVVYAGSFTDLAPGPDLQLRLKQPLFRAKLVHPASSVVASLECASLLRDAKAVVSLTREGETKELGGKEVRLGRDCEAPFDLPGPGKYRLTASAGEAGNGHVATLAFEVPADARGFATDGDSIVRNGKPLFLIGLGTMNKPSAEMGKWLSDNRFNFVAARFSAAQELEAFEKLGLVSVHSAVQSEYLRYEKDAPPEYLAGAEFCGGIFARSLYGDRGGPRRPEVVQAVYDRLAAQGAGKLIFMDFPHYWGWAAWHRAALDVVVDSVLVEDWKPVTVARQILRESRSACPDRPHVAELVIADESRIPTATEMRNMAWQCVCRGASGVIFTHRAWRPWYAFDKKKWDEVASSDCLRHFALCARELADRAELLALPPAQTVRSSSAEVEVGLCAGSNRGLLIVVNTSRKPVATELTQDGASALLVQSAGEPVLSSHSKLPLSLQPLEVKLIPCSWLRRHEGGNH